MTIDTHSPVLPKGRIFRLLYGLSSNGVLSQPRYRAFAARTEAETIQLLLAAVPNAVDIEFLPNAESTLPPLPPAPFFLRSEPKAPVGRSRDPGARGTERPSTSASRAG